MSALKTQDQGLIALSQQDYLPILVESFLVDRKSQGPSRETSGFYTKKLNYFLKIDGKEEFYIRNGPSSEPLSTSEVLEYSRKHFR